jgi:hypothetical protein
MVNKNITIARKRESKISSTNLYDVKSQTRRVTYEM